METNMTEYEELMEGVEIVRFEDLDKDPAYLEWLAKMDDGYSDCECISGVEFG